MLRRSRRKAGEADQAAAGQAFGDWSAGDEVVARQHVRSVRASHRVIIRTADHDHYRPSIFIGEAQWSGEARSAASQVTLVKYWKNRQRPARSMLARDKEGEDLSLRAPAISSKPNRYLFLEGVSCAERFERMTSPTPEDTAEPFAQIAHLD